MNLPRLFKKTSTGADQFWEISTEGNVIVTRWGQLNGKVQETRDEIKTGKNIGKVNETTPTRQAALEARSQWEKKLKKGYVQNLSDARDGKVDDIIEGGVDVMLAHSYEKHGHKIVYPAFVSPKLDGMRIIATVRDGIATLWTRTRKPIKSLPAITRALSEAFPAGEVTLDGEAYSHAYKTDFNKIISLIRPDEPVEGNEAVEYHVFDVIMDRPFSERTEWLQERIGKLSQPNPLLYVHQTNLSDEEEAMFVTADFVDQGYEGGMIKNANSYYEHKRSYHIQKIKKMVDQEFVIVGVEEGRGKLAGHVGSFVCKTDEGLEFKAKLKGDLAYLKLLWVDSNLWRGKRLTVQFQNLTPDRVPRFPVGKAIRDYE